jgi:hypothetical protein
MCFQECIALTILVSYSIWHRHSKNTTDIILAIYDHSLIFRVTIPDAVTIQFDLLRMSRVLLETCRGL